MSNITNDTFTLADIQAATNRLQINTVLVLLINSFCGCIILQNSTNAMAKYKHFLLLTIISSTIMDTHFTFVWGPIPTPPFPGLCSAGFIASKLDYWWGDIVQHTLFHYTFSFVGFSLLIAIMYRYLVLKGQEEVLSSFKGITVISITIIVFPTIPTVTFFFAVAGKDLMFEMITKDAPYLLDIFHHATCAGAELNLWFKLYLISTGFHVIAVYSAAIYFGLKVHYLLISKRHMLSTSTYKLYRQMLASLGVQLTIPLTFLVFPIINLFIIVLLTIPNTKTYCIYTFQTISFHSITNSLSIVIIIKPYRKAILDLMFKLLPRRYRNINLTVLPFPSISATSVAPMAP